MSAKKLKKWVFFIRMSDVTGTVTSDACNKQHPPTTSRYIAQTQLDGTAVKGIHADEPQRMGTSRFPKTSREALHSLPTTSNGLSRCFDGGNMHGHPV